MARGFRNDEVHGSLGLITSLRRAGAGGDDSDVRENSFAIGCAGRREDDRNIPMKCPKFEYIGNNAVSAVHIDCVHKGVYLCFVPCKSCLMSFDFVRKNNDSMSPVGDDWWLMVVSDLLNERGLIDISYFIPQN